MERNPARQYSQPNKPAAYNPSQNRKKPGVTTAKKPSQVPVQVPALELAPTQGPPVEPLPIPREDIAKLVVGLLSYLFSSALGTQLQEGGEKEESEGPQPTSALFTIKSIADARQSVMRDRLLELGIAIEEISRVAAQLAPIMDKFFAEYNVFWKGRAYAFHKDQVKLWQMFPVEDFNSTRLYCVQSTNDTARMVFNLLRAFNALYR